MWFTLYVSDQNEEQIISSLRGLNKQAFLLLTEYGNSNVGGDWDEREGEIKAFSLNYPGVIFQLDCDGIDGSEFIREFYKDGKIQTVVGEIVYPSCTL